MVKRVKSSTAPGPYQKFSEKHFAIYTYTYMYISHFILLKYTGLYLRTRIYRVQSFHSPLKFNRFQIQEWNLKREDRLVLKLHFVFVNYMYVKALPQQKQRFETQMRSELLSNNLVSTRAAKNRTITRRRKNSSSLVTYMYTIYKWQKWHELESGEVSTQHVCFVAINFKSGAFSVVCFLTKCTTNCTSS